MGRGRPSPERLPPARIGGRRGGGPRLAGMPTAGASRAVWSAAGIPAAPPADDVLDALAPWSEAHDVVAADAGVAAETDLPTPDRAGAGLAALLGLLTRRSAAGGL